MHKCGQHKPWDHFLPRKLVTNKTPMQCKLSACPTATLAPDQNTNYYYYFTPFYSVLVCAFARVQSHTEFCLGLYKFLHNLYRSLT